MRQADTTKQAWIEWAQQYGVTNAVTQHATFHEDGTVTWAGALDLCGKGIKTLPAGLTRVEGSVGLSKNPGISLTGLAHISVTGSLSLLENALVTLTGLAAPQIDGDLILQDNCLTTLTGLASATVGGQLWLNNNRLTSLDGLAHVRVAEDIILYHNQLTSVAGLDHVTVGRDLYLSCNRLISVDGLASVRIGGQLHVNGNPNLTDIPSGLSLINKIVIDASQTTLKRNAEAKGYRVGVLGSQTTTPQQS